MENLYQVDTLSPILPIEKSKINYYGYRYYIWKVWAFIILKTHFVLLYQTDCITPKRYSIPVVV